MLPCSLDNLKKNCGVDLIGAHSQLRFRSWWPASVSFHSFTAGQPFSKLYYLGPEQDHKARCFRTASKMSVMQWLLVLCSSSSLWNWNTLTEQLLVLPSNYPEVYSPKANRNKLWLLLIKICYPSLKLVFLVFQSQSRSSVKILKLKFKKIQKIF